MKLVLPVPPSANAYWRVWQNRVLLSAAARSYKAAVKFRCMQNHDLPKPFEGPVVVSMVVYRARKAGDLDNFQKCLLDSIRGVAYLDDSQVVEIYARREDDKENPRVEVRIEEAK